MGGSGSGRRPPKSKKTSTTTKFTSNLSNTFTSATETSDMSKLTSLFGLNKKSPSTTAGSSVTPIKPPKLNTPSPTSVMNLGSGSQGNSSTPTKEREKASSPVTPEIIPPSPDAIAGLRNATPVSRPPVPRPMVTPTTEEEVVSAATTYNIIVQYRSKVRSVNTDAVGKMRGLMARLFQYESSVQLLPFDPGNTSNPIVSSKDVPAEVTEFQVFVPTAFINNKSKTLKMTFRISCNLAFWQLKAIPQIKNFFIRAVLI